MAIDFMRSTVRLNVRLSSPPVVEDPRGGTQGRNGAYTGALTWRRAEGHAMTHDDRHPTQSHDDFDWKSMLSDTSPEMRRYRRIFKHIPREPRCKICAAPFEGPGAPFMRALGRSRWAKNPNFCRICEVFLSRHPGGAEVELTFLFADIRGSTTLGESMTTTEFSTLLNRFYAVGSKVVIAHDGIVDKYVGDEIMAMFAPPFAGLAHASQAVAAARDLLAATGHGTPGVPWAPLGVGIHTGLAFVGSVGEGGMTDFTALGDSVNTTARLASIAAAGEILVSRAASEAAGLPDEGFEQRHLELRGRTEPVDVLVLRATDAREQVSA
jgi:adenylate cyclase